MVFYTRGDYCRSLGEGDQEFGVNHQDTNDDLPAGGDISESGDITMNDYVNKRYYIAN